MNRFFWTNKIKLVLAIFGALLVTMLLSRTILPFGTPQTDTSAFTKLMSRIKNWRQPKVAELTPTLSPLEPTIPIAPVNTIPPLANNRPSAAPTTPPVAPPLPTLAPTQAASLIFSPIGAGISTATNNSGQKYIKIEGGTLVEISEYTLTDGRRIQVIKPLN